MNNEPQLPYKPSGPTILKRNGSILTNKEFQASYFPKYTKKNNDNDFVDIEEYDNILKLLFVGVQQFLAMFGGTILAPLLVGFDVNTSILFSGVGTLLFFITTGGRVPAYLSASFAFLGPVKVATNYSPSYFGELNPNRADAQGAILILGLVYAIIAVLVIFTSSKAIHAISPPVVSGSVVMAIGLNLASSAILDLNKNIDSWWQGLTTLILLMLCAGYGNLTIKQLSIGLSFISSYIIAILVGVITGRPIDFSSVSSSPWFGFPLFLFPNFSASSTLTILPALIALLSENLGHVMAIGAVTNRKMDNYIGRSYFGDALATIVSSSFGGLGVTTYAENIGVITITKVYSSIPFIIAAIASIIIGCMPKFGAVVATFPSGTIGGLEIVLFGSIAVTGARIWLQNDVDLSDSKNIFIGAVTVILGVGVPYLPNGVVTVTPGFQLDGIGSCAVAALLINFIINIIPDLSTEIWERIKKRSENVSDGDGDDEMREESHMLRSPLTSSQEVNLVVGESVHSPRHSDLLVRRRSPRKTNSSPNTTAVI